MDFQSKNKWWLLELLFPSDLEESLTWKLTEMGLRFAVKYLPQKPSGFSLLVWLPAQEWGEVERDCLVASLCSLTEPFGLNFLNSPLWKELNDEDWSISWKRQWQPDPVGQQLLILPAWLDLPSQHSKRVVIRMDPGSAFGTGSHPTTRLCLEELDRESPFNLKVADLGCGSGVLAFAALGLGAEKVYAVDTDPLAVSATIANAQINCLDLNCLKVCLGSVEALQAKLKGGCVDLLMCNILASVIEDLAPQFDHLISPRGEALLSGILYEQAPGLISLFEETGWCLLSLIEKEGWAMMKIRRA